MSIDSSVQPAAIAKNTISYTERLLELMTRRLQLLRSLDSVGCLQAESAGNPDVTALLKILSRKQLLLDELEAIRQALETYHHDDPNQRLWESTELRQQCRHIAEQGNELLRSLVTNDEATLREVSLRRDAVATQLQDGTDSVLARTAYTADNILDASELDIHEV